ncbi:signal peptidase I, partial [Candidatus Woesearchaeota archaeon]|nr:signal peptidase I [Candidatus Woesearchaeota archaeon]
MTSWKNILKKVWYFIWEDNSIWSWLINIILSFVLIKYILYPSLGLLLQTSHPVVAVVSESMEHRSTPNCIEKGYYNLLGKRIGYCIRYDYLICDSHFAENKHFNLDAYWRECGQWYESRVNVSKSKFLKFPFKNGFNKGDIMILKGKKPKVIEIGDVIVFWSIKRDPIIHRVVKKSYENNSYYYYFQTKGDHNSNSIRSPFLDEMMVNEDQIVGNAIARIPLLGYIKIWFVDILNIAYNLIQNG